MVVGRCQAKLGKGIEEREKGEKDLPASGGAAAKEDGVQASDRRSASR